MRSGLEEAQTLHDLLEILVHAVQERSDNIALSQEVALRTSTEKLNDEVGILMTALAAAVTSSHSQIVGFMRQPWDDTNDLTRNWRQSRVRMSWRNRPRLKK